MVQQHHKDWVERLPEALWAYRITWRNVMGYNPYEIVYGKQVFLPIEFQIRTFRTTVQLGLDLSETQQQRLSQINELDEIRQDAVQQTYFVQQQRAKWHNNFIKKKKFEIGDWALLFQFRFKDFKGKLTTRWLGPYEVEEFFDNGAIKIKTVDDQHISFLVNGH